MEVCQNGLPSLIFNMQTSSSGACSDWLFHSGPPCLDTPLPGTRQPPCCRSYPGHPNYTIQSLLSTLYLFLPTKATVKNAFHLLGPPRSPDQPLSCPQFPPTPWWSARAALPLSAVMKRCLFRGSHPLILKSAAEKHL